MTTPTEENPRLSALIRGLDRAVGAESDKKRITDAVKTHLEDQVDVIDALPAAFLEPSPERYARRLLYRDPRERFTVVVMVWGRGQGTPLHDHCGMWCVECVVAGKILVSQFDLVTPDAGPLVEFRPAGLIRAGIGEAGALIPPFDYHKIENVHEAAAVTIHVYGGEMNRCSIFVPEGGRYRREMRRLHYTDE